ncbi:MAG: rhomboid family intramembrane serine protease [Planctomycetes bacterium]|nr:rhomboid family intramembrane serine protease [Planctomycetota bacterium]
MSPSAKDLLIKVLEACAATGQEPLYPAQHCTATGMDRTTLDGALDQLRMSGLVRLTEWVQGKGQGYAVTPEGLQVLQNPGLLNRPPKPPAPSDRKPGVAPSAWERGEAVRDVLMNPVRPIVTRALIAANVLVFVVGLAIALHGGFAEVYFSGGRAGAADTSEVEQINKLQKLRNVHLNSGAISWESAFVAHQWWRLITYGFVHGGAFHILLNMLALLALGPTMETMWGHVRFLYLYLVACLTGGCAVLLDPHISLVMGASGAICGLLASVGAWLLLNRRHFPADLTRRWLNQVVLNVVLVAVISTLPSVSWQGHLGGFVGGALLSWPLNAQRFGAGREKLLGWIGLLVVPLASVAFVLYVNHPRAQVEQFRVRLAPRIIELGQALIDVDSAFTAEMKEHDKDRIHPGDDKRQHVEQEAAKVRGEIRDLVLQIRATEPYRDAEFATEVDNICAYFQLWTDMLQLMESALNAKAGIPLPWAEIRQKRQAMRDLQSKLKNGRVITLRPIDSH